jgi:uncharacterized coiled-coil protein SlyX
MTDRQQHPGGRLDELLDAVEKRLAVREEYLDRLGPRLAQLMVDVEADRQRIAALEARLDQITENFRGGAA